MTNEPSGALPDTAEDLPAGHPAEPTGTVDAGETLSAPGAAALDEDDAG